MMTQALLSAARSSRRGEKLPLLMQRCAATRHAVAGRIQWHRHSCPCAFARRPPQQVAHRVTSQPVRLLIANLELEFHVTRRKITPLEISNRKFSVLSYHPGRARLELPDFRLKFLATSHSSLPTAFLIQGSALKHRANRHT